RRLEEAGLTGIETKRAAGIVSEHRLDQPADSLGAIGEEVDELARHGHPVALRGQKLAIEVGERGVQMVQAAPEIARYLDRAQKPAGGIHLGDLDMGAAEIPPGGDPLSHVAPSRT